MKKKTIVLLSCSLILTAAVISSIFFKDTNRPPPLYDNTKTKRFIIVYPGGGINDMLSVIDKCLTHAIRFRRTLIINTNQVDWFQSNIHEYISFHHPNIYINNFKQTLSLIQNLSMYPKALKGKLYDFQVMYTRKGFVTVNEHILMKLNLEKDYNEDVLIYSSRGGGVPKKLLKHITFNRIVTDVFESRFLRLPLNYASVHVRNTDRSTNVLDFILKHSTFLENKAVFLASDSNETINFFRERFTTNLYSFSKIAPIKTKGTGLHNTNISNHTEFIIDSFVDILMLASAKYYVFSNKKSGYSKLAKYLFDNKMLLKRVLNRIN